MAVVLSWKAGLSAPATSPSAFPVQAAPGSLTLRTTCQGNAGPGPAHLSVCLPVHKDKTRSIRQGFLILREQSGRPFHSAHSSGAGTPSGSRGFGCPGQLGTQLELCQNEQVYLSCGHFNPLLSLLIQNFIRRFLKTFLWSLETFDRVPIKRILKHYIPLHIFNFTLKHKSCPSCKATAKCRLGILE